MAPAASAQISKSQMTQGCRLSLCRSSELTQLCFCCHILPKALKCPRVQEQHLPCPVLWAALPESRATSPGCSTLRGAG